MSIFQKSQTLLEKPVFFQPPEHNALNSFLHLKQFVTITFFIKYSESKQGRKEMIPNDTKMIPISFQIIPTKFCYGLWCSNQSCKTKFVTTEGNDTKWYLYFLPCQYLQHNAHKHYYVIYHPRPICSKLIYLLCLMNNKYYIYSLKVFKNLSLENINGRKWY